VERHGHWHVEIRSPREDSPRLVADLVAAVESLAPGPARLQLRRVGDDLRYVLGPPHEERRMR
jgi:hypothetical protein